MYHRKATAYISEQISRLNSGLKTPYANELDGYITIILYFFTLLTFTYGFMMAV